MQRTASAAMFHGISLHFSLADELAYLRDELCSKEVEVLALESAADQKAAIGAADASAVMGSASIKRTALNESLKQVRAPRTHTRTHTYILTRT